MSNFQVFTPPPLPPAGQVSFPDDSSSVSKPLTFFLEIRYVIEKTVYHAETSCMCVPFHGPHREKLLSNPDPSRTRWGSDHQPLCQLYNWEHRYTFSRKVSNTRFLLTNLKMSFSPVTPPADESPQPQPPPPAPEPQPKKRSRVDEDSQKYDLEIL